MIEIGQYETREEGSNRLKHGQEPYKADAQDANTRDRELKVRDVLEDDRRAQLDSRVLSGR